MKFFKKLWFRFLIFLFGSYKSRVFRCNEKNIPECACGKVITLYKFWHTKLLETSLGYNTFDKDMHLHSNFIEDIEVCVLKSKYKVLAIFGKPIHSTIDVNLDEDAALKSFDEFSNDNSCLYVELTKNGDILNYKIHDKLVEKH